MESNVVLIKDSTGESPGSSGHPITLFNRDAFNLKVPAHQPDLMVNQVRPRRGAGFFMR